MDPRLCNIDHKLKSQLSLNPLDLIRTPGSLQKYFYFVIFYDSQMTSQINDITV